MADQQSEQSAAPPDRVGTAYGVADQLFEADVRAKNRIEESGEAALAAWAAFAATTSNKGLWSVIEQLDRCAFAERWSELRSAFLEQGQTGLFALLMRNRVGPPLDAETPAPDADVLIP